MEGQSGTVQSQHQYQSIQWSRLVRRNTLQASPPVPPTSLVPSLQYSAQIDILPLPSLLPQQPSAYQAQLAHYNKLISSGKTPPRLQSSPLPPLVSAPHVQAVPRGNGTGIDTGKGKRIARVGHGNKIALTTGNGERPLMTTDDSTTIMSSKKYEMSNLSNSRPRFQQQNSSLSHQSNSVPSTPHQHARQFSLGSREPSPDAAPNHSPRSAYSESNSTLPSLRPHIPRYGCKYETAMAHSRRRMAYSIGSDKLEKINPSNVKAKLTRDDERKLTGDMRELYDRLLPTPESQAKRKRFVEKLERLLNDEWPGHDIRVHMFGSSGNLLCTDESDVDICITTEWKQLEGVCMLAELLARHGMEKVICVSTAKVPIVKIWDPELCLACDMNVNNTLALENTRMIKTYVELDERVRPLAMIIKHWTKRRAVNDAAFGGTLSSYTWICMIINFLQIRKPPILPALHQRPHLKLPSQGGHESTFADDVDALRDFGKENKGTLGELLFQFFRFYGHEIDYDKSVISVRNGKLTSKIDKGWHLATNNRLCVEEPFNVSRNLGNTADDTSFRGLHVELRRAFDLIAEAKLDECCEQYVFPKEEERIWEKPVPQPRPILSRSVSQSRGGRGGGNYRGGRNNNHARNGNNSRRASSASSGAFDNTSSHGPQVLPPGSTPQEAWVQTQAAQERLHNDLYTTFSVLQAQENNLRLQLYSQSQAFAQAQAQAYHQVQRGQPNGGIAGQQAIDRHRGNSFDNPPLTAPLRPDMYFYPLQYQASQMYGQHSPNTYPSSPSMSPALPELRRSLHRSSVTGGQGATGVSSGSLRSHSQPAARSIPSPLTAQGFPTSISTLNGFSNHRQVNGPTIPNFIADENIEPHTESDSSARYAESPPGGTPKEYIGYYVNEPPLPQPRREPVVLPAIPAFGDLQLQRRRRVSSGQFPNVILDRIHRTSRSPSPHRTYPSNGPPSSLGTSSQLSTPGSNLRSFTDGGLSLVNGPISHSNYISGRHVVETGLGISETPAQVTLSPGVDNVTTDHPTQTLAPNQAISGQQEHLAINTTQNRQAEFRHEAPRVVNGSKSRLTDQEKSSTLISLTNGAIPLIPSNIVPALEPSNEIRQSPSKSSRLGRSQNGAVSPLDIGSGQTEVLRDELPHLSPVYETRTPSPTANRKFEPGLESAKIETNSLSQVVNQELKPALKLALANSVRAAPKQNGSLKPNGHTRASKSEGSGLGNWQKIPKNKKKAQTFEPKPGVSGTQGQSEQVPKSDSERKGG